MLSERGNLKLLLYLSKNAGLHGSFDSSTGQMSRDLGVSQQTISRKLRDLEQLGLINRKVSPEGISVMLDDRGKKELENEYALLKDLFEKSAEVLSGTLVSGLKEGRYYVNLPKYQRQFEEKLGFRAYPGTLNLSIDPIKVKSFLMNQDKIVVDGFETKERTFGGIDCYKVKMDKDMDAALIIPHRTLHKENVVEIISHFYLRSHLNIKDGNIVGIKNE